MLLVAVALLLAFVPVALALMAVQDTRLVVESQALKPEHAARAKRLVKTTWQGLVRSSGTTAVSATADDLNGLVTLIARSVPGAAGRVNITRWGLEAGLSVPLPSNPFGRYLNIRMGVMPSSEGLSIDHATIGSLELPGWLATASLRTALNLALGDDQGTRILGAVRSVSMSEDSVSATFEPIPELRDGLERLAGRVRDVRDNISPLGDPEVIRLYYTELMEVGRRLRTLPQVSFTRFSQPVFLLAYRRSEQSDVVEENRAAILALAMYLGDSRFEQFIGPVRSEAMQAEPAFSRNVVLGGRRDLLLHFVISAGLQVLSDGGVTHAIGEFKELLDANSGGSGFSFADLAADRAGVMFAEAATGEPGNASRLQFMLARSEREDILFPVVADLPEGISKAGFAEQYGNTESRAYRSMVAEIDQRVRELPAYRATP
jgi:hypothetical protein